MTDGAALRVLTWNLFHARDADGPPYGPRTRAGGALPAGGRLHVNRKLHAPMAAVIARLAPDIAALQEVPTGAVRDIARATRMHALWVTTGPMVGPRRLRDALAGADPDLWRSHEGNANVLLIAPRLRPVPGTGRTLRLNDAATIAGTLAGTRPPRREARAWLAEHRAMVAVTVHPAAGVTLRVATAHLHNSYLPGLALAEARRLAEALDAAAGPAPGVVAGDLNAEPGHPAHRALTEAGWSDAGPARGIDRILHRHLEVLEAPTAVPDLARTVLTPHAGRWWPVLLSDHAPVVARLRLG